MARSKSPSVGSHDIQQTPTSASHTPLSHEHMATLAAFRSELESEGHLPQGETLGTDDDTLLRFLRARKFNLVQAKRMITQCLSWRHQVEGVGIDDLYREVDPFNFPNKQHVFKHWPMYYHRTDKTGRPINIQRFGSLDLAKLYAVVDKEAHFRSILVNCESLTREILPACTHRKLLNQPGSPELGVERGDGLPAQCPPDSSKVTNAFCIIDLKGFSITQFWQIKSIARTCFSISQDYYPETMGYLAIINAPMSFSTIFRAIQPWLSKETISKINILGDDYAKTLLEHVDPENLPEYLGGLCKCNQSDLGNCNYNDPHFEQSPWLHERDWKQQSWLRFGLNGKAGEGEQRSRKEEQDEVRVDAGVTSDGALIITTNKKSLPNMVETPSEIVTKSSQEPDTSLTQESSNSKPESKSAVAATGLAHGSQPKPASISSNRKPSGLPSNSQLPLPESSTTAQTDTASPLFTAQSELTCSQDGSGVHI